MYIYAHTIDLVSIDPVVITLDNILDGGVGLGVEVGVEVGVILHLAPAAELR